MHKLFYIIIISTIVFSLSGCSSESENVVSSTEPPSATENILPTTESPPPTESVLPTTTPTSVKVYDTILSPDEMYEIEFVGIVEESISGGKHPIETIRLINVDTNETVWETTGYYSQTVLWSPNSRYAAISGTARNYGEVILVDRETLNSITIPLPEHGGSEDYNYVEAVEWQSDNELLLLHTDKSPGTPEGGIVKQLIFTIYESKNDLIGSSVYVDKIE